MSPEQVMNQAIDIRSDIYSLGVTLFEMLTANLPFQGESDFQIMTAHVHTPPPPPTRHYPYIPRGIENAVMKAMSKDPATRFQTVEEFGAALEHPEDFGISWGVAPPAVVTAPPPPPLAPPRPSTPPGPPPSTPPGQPYLSQTASTAAVTAPTQALPAAPPVTPIPPTDSTRIGTPAPLPPTPVPVPPASGNAGKLIAVAAVLLLLLAGGGVYAIKKWQEDHRPIRTDHPDPVIHHGGEKRETGERTVWPPPGLGGDATAAELKILEFGSDARRVQAGQTARLHWSVQGATHITITPDVGDVDATGNKEVTVRRTTQFQLTATKLGGEEVHQTVIVEVGPGQPPPPQRLEVSFDAQPDSIVLGQGAQLRWSVPGASLVTITPGIGRVPAAGSIVVKPTETTTYRLQALAGGATGAREVTVQVQQPQRPTPPPQPVTQLRPEIAFHAVPTTVTQGSPVTLVWSLQNAVAAAITPQPGILHQSANQWVVTPAATTTYVLTARSKDGLTASASVTVTVMPPNVPPVVTPPPVVNPPARTNSAMITVVHDHGGAFNATSWPSCYGALQVVNGMLRYSVAGSVDGRKDAFELPLSQVQDISMNHARIKNQPAFHIVINRQHLNFVATGMAATQAVAELRSALGR
jgi:hypothetical protein